MTQTKHNKSDDTVDTKSIIFIALGTLLLMSIINIMTLATLHTKVDLLTDDIDKLHRAQILFGGNHDIYVPDVYEMPVTPEPDPEAGDTPQPQLQST